MSHTARPDGGHAQLPQGGRHPQRRPVRAVQLGFRVRWRGLHDPYRREAHRDTRRPPHGHRLQRLQGRWSTPSTASQVCLKDPVDDDRRTSSSPRAADRSTASRPSATYAPAWHRRQQRHRAHGRGSSVFSARLFKKVRSNGVLLNPAQLYPVLDAATKSLTTDPGLAQSARPLRPGAFAAGHADGEGAVPDRAAAAVQPRPQSRRARPARGGQAFRAPARRRARHGRTGRHGSTRTSQKPTVRARATVRTSDDTPERLRPGAYRRKTDATRPIGDSDTATDVLAGTNAAVDGCG